MDAEESSEGMEDMEEEEEVVDEQLFLEGEGEEEEEEEVDLGIGKLDFNTLGDDTRKIYILSYAATYFLYEGEELTNLYKHPSLDLFLNSFDKFILAFTMENNTLSLTHKLPKAGNGTCLLFYKAFSEEVTEENINATVLILSIPKSPINILNRLIHQIFIPMLGDEEDELYENISKEVQDVMIYFSKHVEPFVKEEDPDFELPEPNSEDNDGEESLTDISKPLDEVNYWKLMASNASSYERRQRAEYYSSEFEKLRKFLIVDPTVTILKDFIEEASLVLDGVWTCQEFSQPYPILRMRHFFDITERYILDYFFSNMEGDTLWKKEYEALENQVSSYNELCAKWADLCDLLTNDNWPLLTDNPWPDIPHIPEDIVCVSRRLCKVIEMRSAHQQLSFFLSSTEKEKLHFNQAFDVFKAISLSEMSFNAEKEWNEAITAFNKSLKFAELTVAEKLRSHLQKVETIPDQLMEDYSNLCQLITRPTIKNELHFEREYIFDVMQEYFNKFQKYLLLEDKDIMPPRIRNMPEVISNLIWFRNMGEKVKEIQAFLKEHFQDMQLLPTLNDQMDKFIEAMDLKCLSIFDNWNRSLVKNFKESKMGVKNVENIYLTNPKGELEVNYSSRLVNLNREIRHFQLLGYFVPENVVAIADRAKVNNEKAKELKEILLFYRTIGDKMIPSQRAMMLKLALTFTKLIKEKEGLTWDQHDQLVTYIEGIKAIMAELSQENRKLRHLHDVILQKVKVLMNSGILKQHNVWKDIILEIQTFMHQLHEQGYSLDNLRPWRAHWDRQIYKALEVQYRFAILILQEHVTPIHIKLTFRDNYIGFSPSIEEIRSRYFTHIRRLFNIPSAFKGVNDVTENLIFPLILKNNSMILPLLYRKAEDLINQIKGVKDRFKYWVALKNTNLEEIVDEYCSTLDDWKNNFKILKAKSQQFNKLHLKEEEKIGFVTITYSPIKLAVDHIISELQTILVRSLQKSIVRGVAIIQDFINRANELLNKMPSSIDEIPSVRRAFKACIKDTKMVLKAYSEIQQRNSFLLKWNAQSAYDLDPFEKKLETFLGHLENQDKYIDSQISQLKGAHFERVENYKKEEQEFYTNWQKMWPRRKDELHAMNIVYVEEMTRLFREQREAFTVLKNKYNTLNSDSEQFQVEPYRSTLIDEIEAQILERAQTWATYEEFTKELQPLLDIDWPSFRSKFFQFEAFLDEWETKLSKETEKSKLTQVLLEEINEYKRMVPNLKLCKGEAFADIHWSTLLRMLQIPRKDISELKFKDFFEKRILIKENTESLQKLHERAKGEAVIREALTEINNWKATAVLSETYHLDCEGLKIKVIKDWHEIINKIGDHISLLQSLKESPFFPVFSDEIYLLEMRLLSLLTNLKVLGEIQREWVFLEPVLGKDVLPEETKNFEEITKEFRTVMSTITSNMRIESALSLQEDQLNTLHEKLQRCHKILIGFLEEKRMYFPRFYFIGDEDLLDILGNATEPATIQSHLKKLFSGISEVDFDSDHTVITKIKSSQGETVELTQPVTITSRVEVWLEELAKEIKKTLKSLLKQCNEVARSGNYDVERFPSQILCLTEKIVFTSECESAITTDALRSFLEKKKRQLDHLTGLRMMIPPSFSLGLKNLILTTIHSIEIVSSLKATGITKTTEWEWQKQLRFYYRAETGEIRVSMLSAHFDYSFEYQGNEQNLVHTPLTEKCYLTLTQGMKLGMGGNPYGPAGTGKTETVKSLGSLLGRQVLVFNCDKGIDVKSMYRIFIGLVMCGAWGCFDEFNRLEEGVLSALSVQIQNIQSALKWRTPEIEILNKAVIVDFNAEIFVTLNPATKGYGARQNLPDNLKQLFRPIAMTKPNLQQISELILYADGFRHSELLSLKMVSLFSFAKEVLSPQKHYDWGLRAIRTILNSCGKILVLSKQVHGDAIVDLENLEKEVLIQAIRSNTLPKLTFQDSQKFDSLIGQVFPNVDFKDLANQELTQVIKQAISDLNFIPNNNQVKKVLELWNQLQERMGVVLVGAPSSGKSSLWTLLKRALERMGRTISIQIINPKAISKTQLLGYIDADTREWHDGILTSCSRNAIKAPSGMLSWLILDGDIDPEWVESLNSVLDDNRLLTMPSGERIQFGTNVNFIFETDDLSAASPATVSRMGMIYLSEDILNLKMLVNAWIKEQREDQQEVLKKFVEKHFYKAVEWIFKEGLVKETNFLTYVVHSLSHLSNSTGELNFLFNLVHGLGANLSLESKKKFAKELFSWISCKIPDTSNILNIRYDFRDKKLKTISLKEVALPEMKGLTSNLPIVETLDLKYNEDTLAPWVKPRTSSPSSILLVGPKGCGKSLLIEYCYQQTSLNYHIENVTCSSRMTPESVITQLLQLCYTLGTSVGKVLRPRGYDRLVLLLKDLDVIQPDEWDTSRLVTWLQQLMTYHGFYDKNMDWIKLESVQIVACVSDGSSPGRHGLAQRFMARLKICSLSLPSADQLAHIYGSYLQLILREKGVNKQVLAKAPTYATIMVGLYTELRKALGGEEWPHYQLSPATLTQWAVGLLRYSLGLADQVLQVLLHEALFLYRAPLVSPAHRELFDKLLSAEVEKHWSTSVASILDDVFYVSCSSLRNNRMRNVPLHGRPLKKHDREHWAELVKKLALFYEHDRHYHVWVHLELLQQLSRLEKALTRPSSTVVLLGLGGVGRHLLLQLVTFLLQMPVFTLNLVRSYCQRDLFSDIKTAIQSAVFENLEVVLAVEDNDLSEHPEFLEHFNSLLSSGEIPGLFTTKELESLLSAVKDDAFNENWSDNLSSYIFNRVKRNLHVVFIMDSNNPDFIVNCQLNPAILKFCHVIYVDSWTENTMNQVLKGMLSNDEVKDAPGLEGQPFPHAFSKLHDSVGKDWATTTKFIALVANFKSLFAIKKERLKGRRQHFMQGLNKLMEARRLVDSMKEEAEEQEHLLELKRKEADEALKCINIKMSSTTDQKSQIEKLKISIKEESKKLEKRKEKIDEQIKEIEPLLNEAKKAVNSIKSDSLSEIRSLRAPPPMIKDILEGVLRIMGITDTSWLGMKNFLAKRGVKEEILSFDPANINPENLSSVENLLEIRADSFEPKNAKRASAAAAPLAAWVKAIVQFARVMKKVQPLEREQARIMENMKATEEQMSDLTSALKGVEDEVSFLYKQLDQVTAEATEIELGIAQTKKTLDAASNLMAELEGEFHRWTGQLKAIEKDERDLPVLALLAAAFITYLSNATESEKTEKMSEWRDAFGIEDFDVTAFISTEQDHLTWRKEGLPSDSCSQENAFAILQSKTCPFLLDPTGQATAWLKQHYKDKPLECVNHQDANFLSTLQAAVSFGKTLLVENLESFDPLLFPLLRQNVATKDEVTQVRVGERMVDYNSNFFLILATKNSALPVPPRFNPVIMLVNFSITRSSLKEQLLECILRCRRPETLAHKAELLGRDSALRQDLDRLEESLLEQLASAQGDILSNAELLSSLRQAKTSSNEVAAALKDLHQLQQALAQEHEVYQPLAHYGSEVYFTLQDLCELNHMYQYGLKPFLEHFERLVRPVSPDEAKDDTKQIDELKKRFVTSIYRYIGGSLFQADRLTFAMHLARAVAPHFFLENEWDAFLGLVVVKETIVKEEVLRGLPRWVNEERAIDIAIFKMTFPDIYRSLNMGDADLWESFEKSQQYEMDFPPDIPLSPFQKVLFIKTFRPERLKAAMVNFASEALELPSLDIAGVNLKKLGQPGNRPPEEPILFIISNGADPSLELQDLANRFRGPENYIQISLGQDQLDVALLQVRECAKRGRWICLTNLHLVTHWIKDLMNVLHVIKPHANFRLWLTSEAHTSISPLLLKLCYKVIYEAPPGIKRNMQRTYETWTAEVFTKKNHVTRARALFSLAWLHAVLQERRNYIPQGWTKFYEFGQADLTTGAEVLEEYLTDSYDIQKWNFIQGLFSTLVYGGKIDKELDLKVLATYVEQLLHPNSLETNQHLAEPMASTGLPLSGDFKEHLQVIHRLPSSDSPEYLGLAANIARAEQKAACTHVLGQLRLLQTRSHQDLGLEDFRSWNTSLLPIFSLWKSLNQGPNLLQTKLPEEGGSKGDSPIQLFAKGEFRGGIHLIRLVQRSLALVHQVARGIATLPSKETLGCAHALLKNKTPDVWQNEWEGPEEPAKYLQTIVFRATALKTWLSLAIKGSLLRKELNLAELFHPDIFLNSLRQETGRTLKMPMDALEFTTNCTGKGIEAAPLVVQVHGLYLEGALFDGRALADCHPSSPNSTPFPPVLLAWTPKASQSSRMSEETMAIPLYTSPKRDHVITFIDVPFRKSQSHWLQCGVALILGSHH